MRLHFSLSNNIDIIPFDYQYRLLGVFQKWMEKNELHNKISLYSFGWLKGGIQKSNGYDFQNGAKWFISFWDEQIGKQIVFNAMRDPYLFNGLKVKDIIIQEEPQFSEKEIFYCSSPIFIRKYDENKKAIHLTWEDTESDYLLTETLKRKLKIANLSNDIKVSYDRNFSNPKTKLVKIKDIKCRAVMCPIKIEGNPEAIKFAWNVGIGHSTGSGFGAIY